MRLLRSLKSKFVRDSAVLQVGGMLNAVGNLVSSVALAHVLGAREQGEFYTAQALYALFYFLINLGVTQATVGQIAAASARGLNEKVANWLAFLAKAQIATGVVLAALGWWLLPIAAAQLLPEAGADDEASRELTRWAWWLCLTPWLDLPRAVVAAAFHGTRRMLPLAQVENGMEACRVVLVVAGAMISGDPSGPVLGSLGASLIGSVLAIDMYRSARGDAGSWLPGLRDIVGRVRGIPLREGMRLGLRIGLLKNIDVLALDVLPPLVIRRFGPANSAELVTYFRIAQRIISMPLMLLQGMTRTALPAFSEYAGRRDYAGLRRVWMRVTLIGGSASSLGVLACLACVPLLMSFFYPPDFSTPVWRLSCVLALSACMQSFHIGLDTLFVLVDRLRVGIAFGLVSAVLYVGLSVLLMHYVPETGLAWAMVIGVGFGNANLIYLLAHFRARLRAPPEPAAQAR